MQSNITKLEFDSSLFGYPVGNYVADKSWNEADFLEQAKDFRLTYVLSKIPLESTLLLPADVKLTFVKKLSNFVKSDHEVRHYTGDLSDQLLSLALESGFYSRFRTDPNFENGEFEKLYRLWIQKSLDRKEVWIMDNLSGFISCQLGQESSQIGLIAIDKKHRGMGFAKGLLSAVENHSFNRGSKILTVATQQTNLPACQLYQKCSYQLLERVFIYHYWKK